MEIAVRYGYVASIGSLVLALIKGQGGGVWLLDKLNCNLDT